jgi:adenylate cyclase
MPSSTASDRIEKPTGRRKLVAVVYADMVGYSRLIGADDVGTLSRLQALRSGVFDPAIAEHDGRIVQTGGDSLLIVFDSIEGAVRCALKVQRQVPGHDEGYSADSAIRFRIGIDIGDAIADGTDLHGDGVIIAARLQAECPAGGICVSRAVRDHVHDRLDLAFEALGPLELKNVARPVEAFVVRPAVPDDVSTSARALLAGNAAETLPLPDRPSIAVLAFTNMSGDPEQEYFSDGIADDIITELSRVRWLFVIARNSSFAYKGSAIDVKQIGRELGVRYVLEGSVRRSGKRIRVNVQLIDAEPGNHIWADRYDRELTDVFAVQDEITLAVAGAIGPAVAYAEQRRALRKLPTNLGAWESYQRGVWHLTQYNSEGLSLARQFFDHALELDATLAAAHTALAMVYNREGTADASRPLSEALRLSGDEAQKALELDPNDAEAHALRGMAAGHLGDYAVGFEHIERALSINPSCALAHHFQGWLRIFTGRAAEGRHSILQGIRLDPQRASNAFVRSHIVMSYYIEGDYETAVAEATRLIADRHDHPYAYRWLAAALGQLGRSDEARSALKKAIEIAPEVFRLFVEQRVPWMGQAVYDHMLDGLRKAGWQGAGESQNP